MYKSLDTGGQYRKLQVNDELQALVLVSWDPSMACVGGNSGYA